MLDKEIIKKKEFTYRGYTIEQLKKMDIREFANLLKSNERRTLMKHYDKIQRFILECNEKIMRNKPIRTHYRSYIIVPQMIGMKIMIHDGKEFVSIEINQEMLGHRLGEFSVTRKRVTHGAAGIGATRSSASMSVK